MVLLCDVLHLDNILLFIHHDLLKGQLFLVDNLSFRGVHDNILFMNLLTENFFLFLLDFVCFKLLSYVLLGQLRTQWVAKFNFFFHLLNLIFNMSFLIHLLLSNINLFMRHLLLFFFFLQLFFLFHWNYNIFISEKLLNYSLLTRLVLSLSLLWCYSCLYYFFLFLFIN
jgi:hypothetical protein